MDPDYAAAISAVRSPPPPTPQTALEYRETVDKVISSLTFPPPVSGDVTETHIKIPSFDGVEISIFHQKKAQPNPSTAQPALVYFHGGGIVGCSPKVIGRDYPAWLTSQTGVQVFAVDYRLAPEHPFPTPVEDCYSAVQWIYDHAEEYGVDKTRVGLIGESGGSTLATGVSLMARDRKMSPPIAKQLLIQPMLDHRTPFRIDLTTARGKTQTREASLGKICWTAYLGLDGAGNAKGAVSSYGSAALAEDLSGLPWTYIEIGSLDLFCAEAIAFGSRLYAAGVDLDMHVYHGLPHIADLIAPDVPAVVNGMENRLRAIRTL